MVMNWEIASTTSFTLPSFSSPPLLGLPTHSPIDKRQDYNIGWERGESEVLHLRKVHPSRHLSHTFHQLCARLSSTTFQVDLSTHLTDHPVHQVIRLMASSWLTLFAPSMAIEFNHRWRFSNSLTHVLLFFKPYIEFRVIEPPLRDVRMELIMLTG